MLPEAVGIAAGGSLRRPARSCSRAVALARRGLAGRPRSIRGARRRLASGRWRLADVARPSPRCCAQGVGLDVSWDAFDGNMTGLREYTWSNRLLQWLPLAGAIGAARGSLPSRCLLGGWFGAFAFAWGASPQLGVGDGSFFVALRAGTARLLAARRLRPAARADAAARLERLAPGSEVVGSRSEWRPSQSKYASQCRETGPPTRTSQKCRGVSSSVR